jgi:very-short-patch-repair endonuclease
VIVEIDGAGHMDVAQWHADIVRHNGLAVGTGAVTLRVTAWEVRNDPDPFFDLLGGLVLGNVIPAAV